MVRIGIVFLIPPINLVVLRFLGLLGLTVVPHVFMRARIRRGIV